MRAGTLVRGAGALALLVVLLGGVPMLLVAVAGWPLPTSVPTVEQVGDALTRTGIPDATVVKVVAVVVWLAWLQLVAGVVAEVLAITRCRSRRRIPLVLGPTRQVAASLVTAVVAIAGAANGTGPVLAAEGARPAAVAPLVHSPARPAVAEVGAEPGSVWTVQRRDTLWGIAEQALGRGERWLEIVRLNTGREVAPGVVLGEGTRSLRAGWQLVLPLDSLSVASTMASRVTVLAGDTLSSIARRCYGDESAWPRLWEANRDRRFGGRVFDDPNLIFAGWELEVPRVTAEDGGTVPTAAPLAVEVVAPTAPPPATPVAEATPSTTPATPVAEATPSTTPETVATPVVAPPVAAPPVAVPPVVTSLATVVPPPATAEPVEVDAQGAAAPSPWAITTGIAGAALLATGVTGLLGARRRRRLERLAVDEALAPPDPELAATERAARAGTDPLAAVRLDVALRALASVTRRPGLATLRPVVVRRRPTGRLDVHLAEPLPAPAPWSGAENGHVWQLAPEVPLADLAALAAGVPAPCPALVLLGTGGDAELYLDLEAVGSLTLGGRPEVARAVARAVVASLAVSPLAERVHVVAAGIDCYGFANEPQVQAVSDAGAGVELAMSLAAPIERSLERFGLASTFALRAHRPEELWEPVVLVAAQGATEQRDAEALAAVGRSGVGVALVTDVPLPDARWRLQLDGSSWRLDPLGAEVTPHGLAADELADLGALLADAVAAPVPAVREIGLAPAAVRFEEPPWTLLVRVLGPVDVVDRLGQSVGFERTKALELVVWLAEHRHHPTRSGARTALWESDVRDATFANVVSDARRALARLVTPPPEEEWIGRTYAEDLPLHRAVITDVELVAARLDHARRQPDHEAVATLREGLALVRGMPYAGTSYLWPDGEALPSHHTVVVVHAALEMANRCLDLGDVDGVFWATAQGMRVLPAHDELVCLRMRAHSLQGNLAGVRNEFECYERAVTADAWGGDLSPKVTDLRRRLAHPVTAG